MPLENVKVHISARTLQTGVNHKEQHNNIMVQKPEQKHKYTHNILIQKFFESLELCRQMYRTLPVKYLVKPFSYIVIAQRRTIHYSQSNHGK